jgi:hypothetical protein
VKIPIIPEIILNNNEMDFVNDTSFLGVILDEQSTLWKQYYQYMTMLKYFVAVNQGAP